MNISYRCPHCSANDSTCCDMNIVDEHSNSARIAQAREVGCRVVHYIDIQIRHRQETDAPTD
jgi:hypothetical protein